MKRAGVGAGLLIIACKMDQGPLLALDALPIGVDARISHIDWDALPPAAARRLREFGFDEGVEVRALHRGALFGRDPVAVRVGRMTVALRGAQAACIAVVVLP